jgi:hypothetical protein
MPSLTDRSSQQIYVNCLVNMYKNFGAVSPAGRRANIEGVIYQLASLADLPHPVVRWNQVESGSGSGSGFYPRYWRLELDFLIAAVNPQLDFEIWFAEVTAPYHELRHVEQYFLMAQAMLIGEVSAPDFTTHGRRAVFPHGTRSRLPDLLVREIRLAGLGYPPRVIQRAEHAILARGGFPQHMIPLVRSLVEETFGSGRRESEVAVENCNEDWTARLEQRNFKGKQAAVLAQQNCGRNRKIHIQAYAQLPMEADAFAVERQVRKMLLEAINQELDRRGRAQKTTAELTEVKVQCEAIREAERALDGARALFRLPLLGKRGRSRSPAGSWPESASAPERKS